MLVFVLLSQHPLDSTQMKCIDVRVFIDRSVVEVFVDDQQCLAVRVYPSLVASTGMSVIGLGGTAELVSLDIWEMRSIY